MSTDPASLYTVDELPDFLRFHARDTETPDAAAAYCRRMARSHSENFIVGSLLIPRPMRRHFYNIYAYCRAADDLADESPDPPTALRRLNWWRVQLHHCFVGRARHPIFVALAETVASFQLTQKPFDDLLDAFELDQHQVRFATFAQLREYCRGSADPVGRIVLRLAAADTAENVLLSDGICTGLQLVNHWQDVREDLARGRIYIPAEDLERFGVEESDLAAHAATPAVRRLVKFEVDRASEYLQQGRPLCDRVPRWLASDIRLFVEGGLAAAQAIEAVDYDVLGRPARVSTGTQLRLLARAYLSRVTPWGAN